MAKTKISEYTSYIYIKQELSKIGWNTHNPARNLNGEVYTQQECLDNNEIAKQLNRQKPEYVIKMNENSYYVIEAKATLKEIDKAFKEAIDYALLINNSEIIKAPIISGVAGNDEDGYIVKSAYFEDGQFKTINYHGKDITSLVTKELANLVLTENKAQISKLEIDESQLLRIAESINEILHAGSINKDERASVMSAIILSMIDDTKPNYEADPIVFVKDINNRAENVLLQNSKREFFQHIEIKLPSNKDAQKKYKKSLVLTTFELLKINIKAAMNSGTDVLGKFYEVFLKYGNGAKDIGIVLTPRHITKFAVRILSVNHKDVIYDPTCGTGGFLVAAFDYVRNIANTTQLEDFKKHKIFGIEQQPKVASLAIVNMIFRGDGKNNIIDNDCLSQALVHKTINQEDSAEYINKDKTTGNEKKAITKVLMNPPFALKDKDEKEYNFIQHALDQMEDGGLLFAIIPLSVMLKGGGYKTWRKNKLIPNNSLVSVITLPEDLFYPVGVNTCAIVVRKGFPHNSEQNVLWIRALNDGYKKLKGKRLPFSKAINDFSKIENEIKMFILDNTYKPDNIPEFMKACPIDFLDPLVELSPEVYLDSHIPTSIEINSDMERSIREYLAFLIRNKKEPNG